MNLLTELIVPLVSVVGTSTAVLIAVDQITAGSRLRRQAIFWRDMAAQEHALSRDSDVSHSLQREALGKLVALSALPAKWLLVPALLVFSAVAAAVMLGVRIGGDTTSRAYLDQTAGKGGTRSGDSSADSPPPQ